MARRYLAFDIETAKDIPGEDFNWRPHRPIGICCAAALPCDAKEPLVWHGKKTDGSPAPRMAQREAKAMLLDLARMVGDGYTLLTWNGLGFDLDVLAEEAAAQVECKEVALGHVDMMFHVVCEKGFPVGIDRAAQALKIPGKPEGMSGKLAPQYWAQGRFQEVLDYVRQDVRMALEVALKCEQKRRFEWLTQKGKVSSMDLPKGWLAVCDAVKLPKPDTSWMTRPIPRSDFTQWLERS